MPTSAIGRPTSVVTSDQEALASLLSIHACTAPRILDVTFNRGRFWKGLPFHPCRTDLDPTGVLLAGGFIDRQADFRALPFPDASYDVLVFDPPHVSEAGSGLVGEGGWGERFGTTVPGLGAEDISGLFQPFLREARRVLVPDGIVLAKIADQTHRNAYRWLADDFRTAARSVGLVPCDQIVKVRTSAPNDPKWRRVLHVRKVHCFWIVVRNGSSCAARRVAA